MLFWPWILADRPCEWCEANPQDLWCQGVTCNPGHCTTVLTEVDKHCSSCSTRCLHAEAALGDCGRRRCGNNTRTLIFLHLQKTGGWSFVDYAKRYVTCPTSTCKPGNHDADALSLGSREEQRRTLNILTPMYPFLHLEQVLNPDPVSGVYVTILRHPLARLLSHYRMATRPFEAVLPFHNVSLMDFASRPLRNCLICGRSKRKPGNKSPLRGGGDHRHCCAKKWLYAADNFYVRELVGAPNLATLPFDGVTEKHLGLAQQRLAMFHVILITEHLDKAPLVLQAKLGWPLAAKFHRRNPAADKRKLTTTTTNLAREPEFRAAPGALIALRKRNDLDIRLYSLAKRIWAASLRSLSSDRQTK